MVREDRPLRGRTIVVTRPRDQAEETVKAIVERGGKPYLLSTIEIQPPKNVTAVKKFFQALACKEADYVIFMSVNGVQHLLAIAENLGMVDEVKANLKNAVVIAVGPRTAQELERSSVRVDLVPEKYTSEGILLCLQQLHIKDKAIYIPRTSEAPPELGGKLRKMGNRVEEIHVYQSQLPSDTGLAAEFARNLEAGKLDAILFTSSLGVKNFIQMLKHAISEEKLKALIARTVVVAIGPTTAKTLAEAAIRVDVMPQEHTLNGALSALASYCEHQDS
jgi:uroporphyrinogen III methyltransferase/synthase